jgi:hypothetical protein
MLSCKVLIRSDLKKKYLTKKMILKYKSDFMWPLMTFDVILYYTKKNLLTNGRTIGVYFTDL